MITAARVLAGLSDEANHRAAAHLAYDAAYHTACEALGLDPDTDYHSARHSRVLEMVRKAPQSSALMQHLRHNLNTLRQRRVTADYRISRPLTQTEAAASVETAASIIQASGQVEWPR
jgi:uncharacterized protein (UPF0332 family)